MDLERLYADLAAIEPFNKMWRDKLTSIARRTRMLTLYAPDRIKALLDEVHIRGCYRLCFVLKVCCHGINPATGWNGCSATLL